MRICLTCKNDVINNLFGNKFIIHELQFGIKPHLTTKQKYDEKKNLYKSTSKQKRATIRNGISDA